MKAEFDLDSICCIAQKAGRQILTHYQKDMVVDRKDDNSPLTLADQQAHAIIVAELTAMNTNYPIISEESDTHFLPDGVSDYWLVDPLDGTKSFIRGEDEFTVNIALIKQGVPVLGVIDVPAQGVLYWGSVGQGAYCRKQGMEMQPIRPQPVSPQGLRVVVSKSHLDDATKNYLAAHSVASHVAAGSSLKFCRVAEGSADCYPRFGPTMQWDTAAGQAILQAAGGRVVTPDGTPLCYNPNQWRNGAFIAWG